MKIVFKNKKELEDFIMRLCPSELDEDLKDGCERYQFYFDSAHEKCRKCWKNCGLKLEVER